MSKRSKIIVIIGANGTLGSCLLNHLDKSENILIPTDIKKKNKKHVNFISVNITREDSIKKMINKIHSKYKRIDVIINCAYPKNKNWGKSFIGSSEKDLKNNLFSQLGSSILICRNFYDYFKKQRYGNLILLSSIQSQKSPYFNHYKNTSMTSPIEYSAIKSGIVSIIKYMAKYSKNSNIRFNSISPGGIYNNQPQSFLKKYRSDCINKGMLDPEDLISAFEFLIDEKSKYVNGQNIVVDDGWSL